MSGAPQAPEYGFYRQLARMINAGQSRSILLYGNVHDLFFVRGNGENPGQYAPLVTFLSEKWQVPGVVRIVYELNGPIRFVQEEDREKLKRCWMAWKTGLDPDEFIVHGLVDRRKGERGRQLAADFERHMLRSVGKPTLALELLRQFSLCSRAETPKGKPLLRENLMIITEAADFLLPAGDGDVSRLSGADRQRVSIMHDWFADPGFLSGEDTVVLIAESASLVHPRVSRLPQVLSVEVPSPEQNARQHYVEWYLAHGARAGGKVGKLPALWGSAADLALFTAGLSIHAMRQLLIGAAYSGEPLTPVDVIAKVEGFICTQLGEDVIEFKKPVHDLGDVVGFTRLKEFIGSELIPRFRASDAGALPGAAVAGPIGGGKTFIFEAVAGALDLPVLVLKNIRSQWFGQTDVVFERLRRVLEALVKVVIFVDEADTQFGGVGAGVHATERRLTAKIQQMMSDPKLRGRVIWLLMTARIHLLSPDIRRPGRVGDLIIPVLDPQGDDRKEFLSWVLQGALDGEVEDGAIERLDSLTEGYSAAAFASLRSELKAKKALNDGLDLEAIEAICHDHILPPIKYTRRYQTLQALVNCTRRSLLPEPEVTDEERDRWELELQELEARGIS